MEFTGSSKLGGPGQATSQDFDTQPSSDAIKAEGTHKSEDEPTGVTTTSPSGQPDPGGVASPFKLSVDTDLVAHLTFDEPKVSEEMTQELSGNTFAPAIVEIQSHAGPSFLSKLSEFNMPLINDIDFSKFGLRFFQTFIKRENADKLVNLPFVKKIHFDRPVNMNTSPVRSALRDFRANAPLLKFKVKPGMIPNSTTKKALGGYEAKELGITGKGITFAVLDTGFTPNRQFIRGGVRTKSTISPFAIGGERSGHGTWTISEIGGKPIDIGDGVIVEGMCPDAKIISIRCLYTPMGMGTIGSTLKALQMAYESGADIISMSLGSPTPTPPDDPAQKIIRAIVNEGRIVCISAGNTGPNVKTVGGPGDIEEAITVGSLSYYDKKPAYFSSRGPTADNRIKPDVVSFGGGRWSGDLKPPETIISSTAGLIDSMDGGFRVGATAGTSMACPHLAGLMGLWSQYYKQKTGKRLTTPIAKQIFKEMGHEKTNDEGYGLPTFQWIRDWMKT